MALNSCNVAAKLGSTVIKGLNNASMDTALDQLDSTVFDGTCSKTYIPGLNGGTMAWAGDYDPTDTSGQVAVVAAHFAKTLLTGATAPTFMVDATHGFTANAYVSACNIGTTVEGKVTVSFTIQLTGDITVV
jgi:hypothetical protein